MKNLQDYLEQYKSYIIFFGFLAGIVYCFGLIDPTTDLRGVEKYLGIIAAILLIIAAAVFYKFFYLQPRPTQFRGYPPGGYYPPTREYNKPQESFREYPSQQPQQTAPILNIPKKSIFEEFEGIGTELHSKEKKQEEEKKEDKIDNAK